MRKRTGPKSLTRWRLAAGLSQLEVADKIVPPVTQPAVAHWERRFNSRPSLATACQLQNLSKHAVPATAWGYSAAEVEAVLGHAPTVVAA